MSKENKRSGGKSTGKIPAINRSELNTTPRKSSSSPFSFLKKRIPAYNILIVIAIAVVIMAWKERSLSMDKHTPAEASSGACNESLTLTRMSTNGLSRPLLMADAPAEAEKFSGLKSDIAGLIISKEREGQITDASVYLRSFTDGSWIAVNNSGAFSPGSLIKVPVMISYLKQEETHPGLLDTEWLAEAGPGVPSQTFTGKAIVPGRKYTVRELLSYMIVESDNNATYMLNKNMDVASFQKLFTDLDLPEPNVHDPNFTITSDGFSRFMRVLYSATYLSIEHSNYALSLLTESSFDKGILQPLPAGVKVAHKFGENFKNNLHELHESGIVWLGDHAYLLTVMTRGNDVKPLPGIISEISKEVYEKMKSGG